MYTKIIMGCLFLGVLVLLVAGCNKNESSTNPATVDPIAAAQQRVNQANQILVLKLGLLVSSQGSDTSAYDMSAANELYREALAFNPANMDAHFGVGTTDLVTLGADPDLHALFGQSSSLLQGLFSGPQIPTFPKGSPTARAGGNTILSVKDNASLLAAKFDKSIRSFLTDPVSNSPATWYNNFKKPTSDHPFSYYQAIIETKLLPVLTDAILHFTAVTLDQNYAFYITPSMVGGEIPDSIRIDLTEIYVLLAVARGLDSEASFLVAYNVDYDNATADAVMSAWQVDSPFLAFRTGGAQRMKDSKTNLMGMMTSIQSGIQFLLNETTHPGIALITYSQQDVPTLDAVVSELDSVKSVFTQTRTIYANESNVNVNLSINVGSFFDNAIGNFKAMIPQYTPGTPVLSDGRYGGVLVFTATSFSTWTFPDPTFNGLLPGMTDSQFKQTFGISASDWKQQVDVGL